jgi:hypothetical protein
MSFALSYGTGTLWMLGLGPVGPGMRLAESSDDRRWHDLVLPFPAKPFAGDD